MKEPTIPQLIKRLRDWREGMAQELLAQAGRITQRLAAI